MTINLKKLETENRNENSIHIDRMDTKEILKCINNEDKKIAIAIEAKLDVLTQAVDEAYEKLIHGGRIIYIGAGTSGRLGILDASECPPTYGVTKDLFVGLIAGGERAIRDAVEGAEDNREESIEDLKRLNFSNADVLIGLAASGRTPYVESALDYANKLGALTIAVSCVTESVIGNVAKYNINPVPGPEVVTGSTRMKAGTAQKLVINMISTTLMIKAGKVYENLMVDLKLSNEKLIERGKQVLIEVCGISYEEAEKLLDESNNDVKIAIVMNLNTCSKEAAIEILNKQKGRIR